MPVLYTVIPGDYLAKIAAQFGFLDGATIWNDPANASLRQIRPNPEVLLPGDRVTIPDKERRVEERPTERRHTFVLRRSPLKLRIAIRDRVHHAEPQLTVDFTLDGQIDQPTTDGNGMFERRISPSAGSGALTALGESVAVHVGFLDPVDSPTGWKARLNNLGYAAGPVDRSTPVEERSALEEFQCDVGLTVTGLADGTTLQKLLEKHGS
ncbi:MAG: peptidoglycan-binding protein [Polyangiaceae bacterium]|nr:peptidoglycan-binding protein [Polyangiaceae bacterium]